MVVIIPGLEIAGQIILMVVVMVLVIISIIFMLDLEKKNKKQRHKMTGEINELKDYINYKFKEQRKGHGKKEDTVENT